MQLSVLATLHTDNHVSHPEPMFFPQESTSYITHVATDALCALLWPQPYVTLWNYVTKYSAYNDVLYKEQNSPSSVPV
jgi:hypothetical protein